MKLSQTGPRTGQWIGRAWPGKSGGGGVSAGWGCCACTPAVYAVQGSTHLPPPHPTVAGRDSPRSHHPTADLESHGHMGSHTQAAALGERSGCSSLKCKVVGVLGQGWHSQEGACLFVQCPGPRSAPRGHLPKRLAWTLAPPGVTGPVGVPGLSSLSAVLNGCCLGVSTHYPDRCPRGLRDTDAGCAR